MEAQVSNIFLSVWNQQKTSPWGVDRPRFLSRVGVWSWSTEMVSQIFPTVFQNTVEPRFTTTAKIQ